MYKYAISVPNQCKLNAQYFLVFESIKNSMTMIIQVTILIEIPNINNCGTVKKLYNNYTRFKYFTILYYKKVHYNDNPFWTLKL